LFLADLFLTGYTLHLADTCTALDLCTTALLAIIQAENSKSRQILGVNFEIHIRSFSLRV